MILCLPCRYHSRRLHPPLSYCMHGRSSDPLILRRTKDSHNFRPHLAARLPRTSCSCPWDRPPIGPTATWFRSWWGRWRRPRSVYHCRCLGEATPSQQLRPPIPLALPEFDKIILRKEMGLFTYCQPTYPAIIIIWLTPRLKDIWVLHVWGSALSGQFWTFRVLDVQCLDNRVKPRTTQKKTMSENYPQTSGKKTWMYGKNKPNVRKWKWKGAKSCRDVELNMLTKVSISTNLASFRKHACWASSLLNGPAKDIFILNMSNM